jgi:peptidoglycan hydrolase-like protein with peptidoglycan-binding domain
VTRAAKEGAVLRSGQALVSVGEEPLFLLTGTIPAYREMYRGVSKGRDVLQLEKNLRALNLDKDGRITPNQTFDSRTEDAVKRLQRRLGFEDDGVVKAGQVVFMPTGSARVAQRIVGISGYAPQGAPVLGITSTDREVTVPLEAGSADIAKVGDAVEVELPDDSVVQGKVKSVGSEARPPAGNPDGSPVIDVKIALRADKSSRSAYDSAPVTVSFEKESAKDVLYVPVTALVALRGGGFAVEVRRPENKTELIKVSPGLFADGNVEVAGSKLKAGMKVVVPK